MSDRRRNPDEQWELRDVWLGLLIFGTGTLLVALAVLAVRNGHGWLAWIAGPGLFLVGPIFVFLGGNAIVRALLAARPRSYREVISEEERVD